MQRVLFVCGKNRRRSPTAEHLFAGRPGLEVASAGLAADADEVVTVELVEWADLILVMERAHLTRLRRRFRRDLRARVASLDIPDDFAYMQTELVALLEARVPPHLR